MKPPTLGVEVRSEGQSLAFLREKCRYYRDHGVDTAWLIDPLGRRAELFEAGREGVELPGDGVLTSAAMPGFALPLADLWRVLEQED
jgi:Uma2 family endonuclease